jgi:(p)ppGpp synthase/HD superfamily hydrolase
MTENMFRAIEFATKAHSGQLRKGTGLPYIIHPLNVAKILIESDCSETEVVAGILHDTVEDTPATLNEIRSGFGDAVAEIVWATSEPDKSDTWENRKNHTLDVLKDCAEDVLHVSFADKMDNIRSTREDLERTGHAMWSRFNRPKEKQRWYFESLVKIFDARLKNEPFLSLSKEFRIEVATVFDCSRVD